MEISFEEAMELLKQWGNERPPNAKYPRVEGNPYGDNRIGIAFDEGWWACMKRFYEDTTQPPPTSGPPQGDGG